MLLETSVTTIGRAGGRASSLSIHRHSSKTRALRVLLALAAAASGGAAFGSSSYSGSVDGIFTNEETNGFYLDANYNPVWIADTAPDFTGDGTNSITAGLAGSGSAPNQWTFFGASFTDIAPGQVFLLGQLEFFNGTTAVGTDVFGGDLTLNFDLTLGTAVTPLTLHYDHIGTVNTGDQHHDADWLNFFQVNTSFHVYENDSAFANIYGRIVGDPYADGITFQLVPDVNGNINGFLGPNQPAVPGPPAMGPFLLGTLGLARRRLRG